MGDQEWEDLKASFVNSFSSRIKKLEQVIEYSKTGQIQEAAQILLEVSHKLAGVASSYGFEVLSEKSADIEERIEVARLPDELNSHQLIHDAHVLIREMSLEPTDVAEKWLQGGLCIYAMSTLVSMAVMSLGVVAFWIGLAGYVLNSKNRNVFLSAIRLSVKERGFRLLLLASTLLTLACGASLVGAHFFPLIYFNTPVQVHWFKDMAKLWYLFWPFILLIAIRLLSTNGKIRVLRFWWTSFAIVSAVGVIQYFTGWPRLQHIPGNEGRYHATLFFGHHLSTASILIFPFFVHLEWIKKNLMSRWISSVVLAMATATLFFTYSRTLWGALPIGILLWMLWIFPARWRKFGLILSVVTLGLVSQLSMIQMRINDSIGIGSRQMLWKIHHEFFSFRPWTGVGWQHTQEMVKHYFFQVYGQGTHFVGHAHNMFLEMLSATGVFGLTAWLFWIGVWLFLAVRVWRRGQVWGRAMICAWLVFQLNGMTQVNFWEAKVLHQVMWVLAWVLLLQFERSDEWEEKWLERSL